MASDSNFVEFVVDQLKQAGSITYRKMFGEYGLYCDLKIIGLICSNQLFVKPTNAGRAYILASGDLVEAPPYDKAKPYFLIEDQLDDSEWVGS